MNTFESKLIEENQKLLKKLDQQAQLLAQKEEKINKLQLKMMEQTDKIDTLIEQVEFLSKKLFGSSSEKTKVDPGQLTLFGDPVLEEPLTKDEPTEEITYRRRKTSGRKAELTKDLPIEEVHCELHGEDCTCDHCGQAMKPMGKKVVREEVCFVPARLYKKVYISHAYECDCHDPNLEAKSIRCAEVPKGPIQRSLAGPTTLAWLFHQKFELGLPTYRQEKEWSSYGLEVSRKTLSNWIIRASFDWLEPLYKLFLDKLCQQEVLHADETYYQILNRSDGKPATSEARIWLIRTIKDVSHPIVFYHADLTRAKSVILELLRSFKGWLHCDGYIAYKDLPNVTTVGCWAHARRKFQEVSTEHGKAKQAVHFCNQIFRLERELIHLSPEERQIQRESKIRPIIESFYQFIEGIRTVKGKLQTAIVYAQNQRRALTEFLSNGRLEISNNLAEQAIRPVVVGRKNYLFSTSVKGAQANAMAYTLIETAKANGLNVYRYLTYLFEKLPNCEFLVNPQLLGDFLPWSKIIQENCK